MELSGDMMCFVCGPDNPIGLKLSFAWRGEEFVTEFVPGPEHQSFVGFLHGGIMTAVLDEVMGKLLFTRGIGAMTARMEVRFRRPAPIGAKIVFVGKIQSEKGRRVEMSATAADAEGELLASAEAVFMRV